MKQERKLVREIASHLIEPVAAVPVLTGKQFHADLIANAPYVATSLSVAVKREFGQEAADAVTIRVAPIDEQDFTVQSNLQSLTRITELESHKLIERALLAVSGINQRLAEMQSYDALANFWYRDLPILDGKLRFLQNLVAPETLDQRLATVVNLPALPDLVQSMSTGQFNVERFLEIRLSDEAAAFRALASASGQFRHSAAARVVREPPRAHRPSHSKHDRAGHPRCNHDGTWPRTGANIAAAGLELVDAFLLERLFGHSSAPLAFLLGHYRSVFDFRV